MKQKVNGLNVIKYAGAYIAFIIGSGFATGQEIIQFYTSYGIWGIGSIAISMFLFAWVGGTVTVWVPHQGHGEGQRLWTDLREMAWHIL